MKFVIQDHKWPIGYCVLLDHVKQTIVDSHEYVTLVVFTGGHLRRLLTDQELFYLRFSCHFGVS